MIYTDTVALAAYFDTDMRLSKQANWEQGIC